MRRAGHAAVRLLFGIGLGAGPALAADPKPVDTVQEVARVPLGAVKGAAIAVVPPPPARLSGMRSAGGRDAFAGYDPKTFPATLAGEVALALAKSPWKARAAALAPDEAFAASFLRREKGDRVKDRLDPLPKGLPGDATYVAVLTWAELEGELRLQAHLESGPGVSGSGAVQGPQSERFKEAWTPLSWCELHLGLYRVSDGALVLHQAGTGQAEVPFYQARSDARKPWRRACRDALNDLRKELRRATREAR